MTAGSFSPVDASDDFGKSSLEGRMLHEVLPSDEIFIVQRPPGAQVLCLHRSRKPFLVVQKLCAQTARSELENEGSIAFTDET